MRFSKKRGAREVIWGPEEPWVEPKKEIIAGPAADLPSETSGENALGFIGSMAGAAEPNSSSDSETTRSSSPYGWEPDPNSSSSSSSSSESSDSFEKIMRLQRKIDNLVERIEALERKMND